jgi:hypothetical protein
VSLACDKAKDHGHPHELTTRLLARHAREIWRRERYARSSARLEIKPHKVRYYLERGDAEFEQKMAEVLCVYRKVQVL